MHKGSEDDQGGGGKSVHTCAHTHQVRVDCMYVAGRGGGGSWGSHPERASKDFRHRPLCEHGKSIHKK